MFFWNSLASSMIQRMLAIWALLPLPFLNPVWTSGRPWFTYYWSLAWRILSITLLACEMSALCSRLPRGCTAPYPPSCVPVITLPQSWPHTGATSPQAHVSYSTQSRLLPLCTDSLPFPVPWEFSFFFNTATCLVSLLLKYLFLYFLEGKAHA